MEDFFFHFFKKLVTSGYLKTGYLTGYLRVEVTRGHQKKNMPRGGVAFWSRFGSKNQDPFFSKSVLRIKVNHPKCILTRP